MATILVVDDKEFRRQEIKDLLQKNGYEVITIPRAHDATWAFMDNHFCIDLVLTDTNMPEVSGIELAECIREEISKTIPIIGMSKREENRQFYEHFWLKSEPPEILIGLIKKLTAQK